MIIRTDFEWCSKRKRLYTRKKFSVYKEENEIWRKNEKEGKKFKTSKINKKTYEEG